MSNELRKVRRKAERRMHAKSRLRLIGERSRQRDLDRQLARLSGIIVHGAGCTWWDVIENAGHHTGAHPLPCCPHCGSVLYQHDNEQAFWAGSKEYEKTHPGYIALMQWMKGKCFKTMADAAAAYESETGIHYEVASEAAAKENNS